MHEKHIGVPLGIIRFLRPGKEREPRRRLAMLPDLVRRLHAHAVHGADEMLRDARVDDGRILLVVGTLLQKIIETLARLEGEGRVVARYLDDNPNGSLRDIAGITNERGNVVGLMPHPEHAVEEGFGPSLDGRTFFTSVLEQVVSA